MIDPHTLHLQRVSFSGDSLLGVYYHVGRPICLSLENYPKRIPAGVYRLGFEHSARFGDDCLTVFDVPGRTGIRVHTANFPDQLEGCLSAGSLSWERVGHEFGLSSSAVAVTKLRALARNCLTHIHIEDSFHA